MSSSFPAFYGSDLFPQVKEKELLTALDGYAQAIAGWATPFPDAQETLRVLRPSSYRLGLLSNTWWAAEWHNANLATHRLDDLLDVVVYYCSLSHLWRKEQTMSVNVSRTAQVSFAVRIEVFTVMWMVVEAIVSIGAGIIAGSALLTAFGIDSVIELVSGGILLWRLLIEANGVKINVWNKQSIVQLGLSLFHLHCSVCMCLSPLCMG